MKTHLVIGSNSFTGSHIVDALLAEWPAARVIGVSRSPEHKPLFLPYKQRPTPGFEFHQINMVTDFDRLVELMEKTQPGVVINVAALSEVALSSVRPVEYFETNTLATVKLAHYLRARPYLQRYVHISSAEIFGPCNAPLGEEARFRPSTPYAVSKAAADLYLNTLIRDFGFPATLIRSTNVYGKHQQLFKIIPRTIIYVRLGKTLELHGGGKAVKAFIHVRDVVRGVLLALQKGQAGTYHFSVPDDQTVADVVEKICTWMGYDFRGATRVVGERLGQDSRYWLDSTKAERELGWAPRVSFEGGVREVIAWISEEWDQIQREPLEYQHRV